MQQYTACLDGADSVFVACLGGCPTTEPCIHDAWVGLGIELSRCNDAYFACIMTLPPEICEASRPSCIAHANERFETQISSQCAIDCTVPVAPLDWGTVKRLYRD